jgi:RHS repeat-associated protein
MTAQPKGTSLARDFARGSYTDSVAGTWNLSYDSLNRLLVGTPATGNNLCWSYDSFGNRTAQDSQTAACPTLPSVPTATASYNTNNQVTWTSVNGAANGFTYDAAGNVTYDGVNTYIYDGEGRICAVKNEPVAGTYTMTQYIYDAEGNRVAKGAITNWTAGCNTATNGFTPTNSYVLGLSNEQLTETDGNGKWTHTNVYAAGMLIATYDIAPTGDSALHFQLEDWLGTRRVQTDISGNSEETYTNLPFGDGMAATVASGAPSTADDATEHHFTQKQRDTETGNDYFGARYYASSTGRFLSPDWSAQVEPVPYAKLGDPQSLNLYSYLENAPLNGVDAGGHVETGTLDIFLGGGGCDWGAWNGACSIKADLSDPLSEEHLEESAAESAYNAQVAAARAERATAQAQQQNASVSATGQQNQTGTAGHPIDKGAIVNYADQHAAKGSLKECATYCRRAFEAGGVDTKGHPIDAKDWGPTLLKNGASVVSQDGYSPQKADVAVFAGSDAHPSGHITIYDGKQWVSDFKQKHMSPYGTSTPPVTIYRFPDN